MYKILICSLGLALVAGCGDDDAGSTEEPLATGTLRAALAFVGDTHDVAAMRYVVVDGDADCDGEPIAEAIEPLETEALPLWLTVGPQHAFADGLFVLQPGVYRVCVAPITEDGEPSAICAPVTGLFEVFAEQTTEGVLYSQCLGDPSGGLDVIAALNDPPHIDDLEILESKFITTCERAVINVIASDPNGDPLFYDWAILEAPPGANPILAGDGPQAAFASDVEGPHLLRVTVSDGLGGETHLDFPIHVSFEDCGTPCERNCDLVAEQLREGCLQLAPPEVCDAGADLVRANCLEVMCQPPPDCRAGCERAAAGALEDCLGLPGVDPALCEQGAAGMLDICVQVFQCPPPPLPCPDQCLADANAFLPDCVAQGAGPPICPDRPDPNFHGCLVVGQQQLTECVFGPEGCFPQPESCEQACDLRATLGFQACIDAPQCQEPVTCQLEAQDNNAECRGGCCMGDCLTNECAPLCNGDPDCMMRCEAEVCEPRCFPEPSCEEQCADEADNALEQCIAAAPPLQCNNPQQDCLGIAFQVFADCSEIRCGADGCQPRCVGECIARCEDPNACQGDPALTEDCVRGCQPQ